MTKQLTFLLTSPNTRIMIMSMAHLLQWSALDWVGRGRQHNCSAFSGSILSSYQMCCQGLQSRTAVHISLCDIRLQRDDGKEAATVTVRDEGHTLVLGYQLHQCHKDKFSFYLDFIYSLHRQVQYSALHTLYYCNSQVWRSPTALSDKLKYIFYQHHPSCFKCVYSNWFSRGCNLTQ